MRQIEYWMSSCYWALNDGTNKLFPPPQQPTTTKSRSRIITWPNILSLSRIPLSLMAGNLIDSHRPATLILILIIGASLTDYFDGFWARREGPSRLGELLDPWCDKFFIIRIGWSLYPYMWPLVLWPLLAIEISILALSVYFARKKDINVSSPVAGKYRFTAECAGAAAFIVGLSVLGNLFLALAIVLVWFAGKEKKQNYKSRPLQ